MALQLTVIAPKDEILGERGRMVFGVGGGRIGRALDNDWVLPDPLRYLSSHHARVKFRQGSYFIEDTSTNGVYLNDAEEPLGKSGPQPLRSGDLLRIGTYQIEVSVGSDNAVPADPSVVVPYAAGNGVSQASGERDIGIDLSLNQLLVEQSASRSSSSGLRPVDAYGQPLPGDDSGIKSPPPVARVMTNDPRREPRNGGGVDSGAEAFCRGAGLDPARLPPELQGRAMHLAGLLLREALAGVKSLAGTQLEIRHRTGISALKQDADREALQRLAVEDLMLRLLGSQGQDSLDAVQWLRELFGNARNHDVALMRALRSALADYIQRLEPNALGKGRAPQERFRNLTDMPAGELPHLFAEALARSFDEEIKHI